jgi:hypothetical protein
MRRKILKHIFYTILRKEIDWWKEVNGKKKIGEQSRTENVS